LRDCREVSSRLTSSGLRTREGRRDSRTDTTPSARSRRFRASQALVLSQPLHFRDPLLRCAVRTTSLYRTAIGEHHHSARSISRAPAIGLARRHRRPATAGATLEPCCMIRSIKGIDLAASDVHSCRYSSGAPTMRKLSALLITAMLAGATLVDPADSAPAWQYGWWQPGAGGQWGWTGAWGPGGRWVRRGPSWVYRSRAPAWQSARWVRGPGGRWVWRGGWGPGGAWVRQGPNWVYRWR
jgi:hypothetical protein